MKKLLLNLTLSSIVLLMPITSFSYAESRCDDCYHEFCGDACPCVTLSADYLYWNTCRSNMGYIFEATSVVGLDTYKIISVDNDWNSGFRVNAEYICDNQWEANARFTWFRGSLVDTTPGADIDLNPNALFKGEYTVNYKVLDFELGSWYPFKCDFAFHPFVGLKFAWIDESFKVKNEVESTNTLSGFDQDLNVNTCGAVVGADVRYNFCRSFDLIARAACGVHYGSARLNPFEYDEELGEVQEYIKYSYYDCHLMYSSEFAIGFEKSLCLPCGSDVNLAIGYEFHGWDNLAEFIEPVGDLIEPSYILPETVDATLMFHGLFVRLTGSF